MGPLIGFVPVSNIFIFFKEFAAGSFEANITHTVLCACVCVCVCNSNNNYISHIQIQRKHKLTYALTIQYVTTLDIQPNICQQNLN